MYSQLHLPYMAITLAGNCTKWLTYLYSTEMSEKLRLLKESVLAKYVS